MVKEGVVNELQARLGIWLQFARRLGSGFEEMDTWAIVLPATVKRWLWVSRPSQTCTSTAWTVVA